jgi:hypothetical protein
MNIMIDNIRLFVVLAIKKIINCFSDDQEDINAAYERLYIIAKRITYYLRFNRVTREYLRTLLCPLLVEASNSKPREGLEKAYNIVKSQRELGDTNIFILASGQASRWERSRVKQLALYKGKPIIEHILTARPEAVVVSHHAQLARYSPICPSKNYFVLETILSTHREWKKRTIFLLGDTIYGKNDLDTILNYSGDFMIFGSKSQVEIFGISFSNNVHDEVIHSLCLALIDAYQGGRGKIWEFYHTYNKMPMYKIGIGSNFTDLHDTTDIDSLDEYHNLLKGKAFKKLA